MLCRLKRARDEVVLIKVWPAALHTHTELYSLEGQVNPYLCSCLGPVWESTPLLHLTVDEPQLALLYHSQQGKRRKTAEGAHPNSPMQPAFHFSHLIRISTALSCPAWLPRATAAGRWKLTAVPESSVCCLWVLCTSLHLSSAWGLGSGGPGAALNTHVSPELGGISSLEPNSNWHGLLQNSTDFARERLL